MEENSPEKRWVRFRKRTHREGYFGGDFNGFDTKNDGNRAGCPTIWRGRGDRAPRLQHGWVRYLNLNGWLAASHL